jgi:hypothetical protein
MTFQFFFKQRNYFHLSVGLKFLWLSDVDDGDLATGAQRLKFLGPILFNQM